MSLTAQMIEILYYKFYSDFNTGNIQLGDNGSGTVITYWNVSGVSQPNEAQILAWATDSTFLYNRAYYKRRDGAGVGGYEDHANMFEKLYADLVNNTTTFTDHMSTVQCTNWPLDGTADSLPTISRIAKLSDIPAISNTAADRKLVIATSSSAQSISGTSKVTVTLGTEELDAANCFASNTFTAPTNGIYEFSALLRVDNAAIVSLLNAYPWQLYLTKNGSTSYLIDEYTHAILGAIPQRIQGTRMIQLAASDTVVLQVQKTLSTALNINSAYFHAKKVSDL